MRLFLEKTKNEVILYPLNLDKLELCEENPFIITTRRFICNNNDFFIKIRKIRKENNKIINVSGDFVYNKRGKFGKKQEKSVKSDFPDELKIKDFRKIVSEDKKSKLVGPIDELAGLTIKDFRSWSENSYEAIKKIKEKINILIKESLEKGNLGMKAWKNSEINKAYLDILHSAIIKRKQVNEIIQEMKNERKQTLTLEEFEAIEQLNRELRA